MNQPLNNNMLLDVSFEFDLKGLEESERQATNESAISSFLRTKKQGYWRQDVPAGTQHTVSTLGSSADDADEWSIDDSEISLGSFQNFNFDSCGHLLDDEEDQHIEGERASDAYFDQVIDQALRINIDDEATSMSDPYYGFGSHHLTVPLQGNDGDCLASSYGHSSLLTCSDFGDSVSSLTGALEKLNACITRTAETRRIVRDMTTKMTLSEPMSENVVSQRKAVAGLPKANIAFHSSASSVGSEKQGERQ